MWSEGLAYTHLLHRLKRALPCDMELLFLPLWLHPRFGKGHGGRPICLHNRHTTYAGDGWDIYRHHSRRRSWRSQDSFDIIDTFDTPGRSEADSTVIVNNNFGRRTQRYRHRRNPGRGVWHHYHHHFQEEGLFPAHTWPTLPNDNRPSDREQRRDPRPRTPSPPRQQQTPPLDPPPNPPQASPTPPQDSLPLSPELLGGLDFGDDFALGGGGDLEQFFEEANQRHQTQNPMAGASREAPREQQSQRSTWLKNEIIQDVARQAIHAEQIVEAIRGLHANERPLARGLLTEILRLRVEALRLLDYFKLYPNRTYLVLRQLRLCVKSVSSAFGFVLAENRADRLNQLIERLRNFFEFEPVAAFQTYRSFYNSIAHLIKG